MYSPWKEAKKAVNVRVPITQEGGRTTECDRPGDRTWNTVDEDDKGGQSSTTTERSHLLSSVAYPVMNSQSLEMLRELEKVGTVDEVAASSDDGMEEDEEGGQEGCLMRLIASLTERMVRSEKLIMEMRDEIDRGKDFRMDIISNGCPGCKRSGKVKAKKEVPGKTTVTRKPNIATAIQRATRSRIVENSEPSKCAPIPINEPTYMMCLEKKGWSNVANNDIRGGIFNFVARKTCTPQKRDPITQIAERES